MFEYNLFLIERLHKCITNCIYLTTIFVFLRNKLNWYGKLRAFKQIRYFDLSFIT